MFSLALIAALSAYEEEAGAKPAAAPLASGPVVVELFTSQGCGLSPAANRFLAETSAENPHLLALSYGVDHWDAFGWEDRYAKPAFAERQRAYVEKGRAARVYTPHFVVNGDERALRFKEDRFAEVLTNADPVTLHAAITRQADTVRIALDGPPRETRAEVWAVSYSPGVERMEIEAGSNAGKVMEHYNMVRTLTALPGWSGGLYQAAAGEACPQSLACAVLVQDGPGGAIMAAGRLAPVAAEPPARQDG